MNSLITALVVEGSNPEPSARILSDRWTLLPDATGTLTLGNALKSVRWRPAQVGVCWNAQYADLRDYMGVMWYRLSLDLHDSELACPHLLLQFGAVDYYCEIFVNGQRAGCHEGGYTPFTIDIAAFVHGETNVVVVRVIDPPIDEACNTALCPEMMYNEIPHGKQSWYVQNGGIWQPVRLQIAPALYIDQVQITPSMDGSFVARVEIAGDGLQEDLQSALQVRVYDPQGNLATELSMEALPGNCLLILAGRVPSPQLWDIDTPNLYSAEVSLSGKSLSRKQVRFGFRSFEAREGKLFLNGKPFYLRGVLDQDFHADSIHSPGSKADIVDLMQKARQLGVNVMRCHLKICAPEYLEAADEMGMLVWAELPSWSDCWYNSDHFSHRAAERSRRMFDEVLTRDWNHPSIVIQTIINESWGMDLQQPEQREWLKNRFREVRAQIAPLGRLVIDNSPCEKNFHLVTDIEDFHNYYSIPDDAHKWEKWTRELASRPTWTFSPFGDAERTGHEPLLVSEFGNWGLPQLPEQLPWWLECDFSGRPATSPAGVHERFARFGYDSLFADYNAMAEATQRKQFVALKHEIEDIRQHASLQGYVITGLTDIHWEANGLLDQHRRPKAFCPELSLLQRPDLVMIRSQKRNYLGGEEAQLEIILSHYGDRLLCGSTIRWSVNELSHGEFILHDELEMGSVTTLGRIQLHIPQLTDNRRVQVYAEVTLPNGEMLTANTLDLFLYKPAPAIVAPVALHDPQGVTKGACCKAACRVRTGSTHRADFDRARRNDCPPCVCGWSSFAALL